METEKAAWRRGCRGALRPVRLDLALVAVARLLSACARSAPHAISWLGGGGPAAAHGERIRSWPQAVSSVAETMRGPLGLPLTGFSVHFFDGREALERGLAEAGTAPEIARRAAATFNAVGRPDGVYVNERRLARAPARVPVGIGALDLVVGAPLVAAVMPLAQPRLDAQIEAVRRGDRLRRLAGAQQVARVHGGERP